MKENTTIKSLKSCQIRGMEKNAKRHTPSYGDEHLRLHNKVDGMILMI